MTRHLVLVSAITLVLGGATVADEDAIGTALKVAKQDHDTTITKSRDLLVAQLKSKADALQKAGDLNGLEKVEAELKSFTDKNVLPKAVSSKVYEGDLRRAKLKLEDAYASAVKEYTKAGLRPQAKAVQQELEELKRGNTPRINPATPPVLVKASDPFHKGSNWSGTRTTMDNVKLTFEITVNSRENDRFSGMVAWTRPNGQATNYNIFGTVKGADVQVKTDKVGAFYQEFNGKWEGKKLTLTYQGTSSVGDVTNGTAFLELKGK